MSFDGRYLLALDQGTTSSRAILFDHSGDSVASAQQEFTQHYPADGWVEHEPEDIWQSQLACAREAMSMASLGAGDVAAIGITNQRETTLLWDRASGEPLHRAIVWQDRRTAALCDTWSEAGLETLIHLRTGLLIDPYFSASKLSWLLDHVDGARARAEAGELAFGTVDSWLIWKLTEGRVHAADATNACRTMLYHIHAGKWDADLLAALEIPAALLPQVHPPSGQLAEVSGVA